MINPASLLNPAQTIRCSASAALKLEMFSGLSLACFILQHNDVWSCGLEASLCCLWLKVCCLDLNALKCSTARLLDQYFPSALGVTGLRITDVKDHRFFFHFLCTFFCLFSIKFVLSFLICFMCMYFKYINILMQLWVFRVAFTLKVNSINVSFCCFYNVVFFFSFVFWWLMKNKISTSLLWKAFLP